MVFIGLEGLFRCFKDDFLVEYAWAAFLSAFLFRDLALRNPNGSKIPENTIAGICGAGDYSLEYSSGGQIDIVQSVLVCVYLELKHTGAFLQVGRVGGRR